MSATASRSTPGRRCTTATGRSAARASVTLLEGGEVGEAAAPAGASRIRWRGKCRAARSAGATGLPDRERRAAAPAGAPRAWRLCWRGDHRRWGYPSVANVGTRPTFGEEQPLIEVHLLEFSGDLYGQHLAFDFVEQVRPIRRFDSIDALRAQIAADIAGARACLARR